MNDEHLLHILLEPIRVCVSYQPRLGQRVDEGFSLEQFQALYRADPFYSWYGLDHPMMYTAHRAAGGMTSVYRQIGIGVERLFRAILQDRFGLSAAESQWSYKMTSPGGKMRTLTLDGRIELAALQNAADRERVKNWMDTVAQNLGVATEIRRMLKGVVFEVRQGYKSKDAKRQNADIANASMAYTSAYIPCLVVFSNQIDEAIVTRYRNEQWVILTGAVTESSPVESTYAFVRDVLGFDLAGFFTRNSTALKREVERILQALLAVRDRI